MDKYVIVLAAGKGAGMNSRDPEHSKVSYPILGKPIINYVIDAVKPLDPKQIVTVVGFGGELTAKLVEKESDVVWQKRLLGTGHAVLQAKPFLEGKPGQTLVIYGDTPLVETETLRQIFHIHEKNRYDMTVVSAVLENPKGYGRILREDKSNRILAIREESDCTFSEYEINEVNTGICIIDNELLFKYIERLSVDNNRHLFYLSELVQLFIQDNYHVGVFVAEEMKEVYSINDRIQLAYATKIMRKRINNKLMLSGVSMEHSGSSYISPDVKIGQDTIIRPNTTILGNSVIGEACIIGPNVVLKDVEVGNDVEILFADISDEKIENGAKVGPFVEKHGKK